MKGLKTYVTICLDASGSMDNIRDATIEHFNAQLAILQKDPVNKFLTLVKFGDSAKLTKFVNRPIDTILPLSRNDYAPQSDRTAQHDGIGLAIETTSQTVVKTLSPTSRALIIVISDGDDNGSVKYNSGGIKKMVEEKTALGNWTFAYLGANQNLDGVCKRYGIPKANGKEFSADPDGMEEATLIANQSLSSYSSSGSLKTDSYFNIGAK